MSVSPSERLRASGSSFAPSVVAIGNFDGVHSGHRALLARASLAAKRAGEGTELVVLTFDPHPAAALGRTPPPRLTTARRREELLLEAGVDRVETVPFTAEFAHLSPEAFVAEMLIARLHTIGVFVGANFRFGHKRAGDLATLQRLGADYGFFVGDPELLCLPSELGPVSSSRIREAIATGSMEHAREMLGREHALEGVVVHGDAKGRTLGFPTANLAEFEEMVPAHGVYATRVSRLHDDGSSSTLLGEGVTNIGVRPTVTASAELRVETHLLPELAPEDLDLYGARIRVSFVAKIRDEKRFASFEELRTAIASDVETARKIHREYVRAPSSSSVVLPRSAEPLPELRGAR